MAEYQLNFLAVGPFKTGTTWIYEYLKMHDNICVPKRTKETFFFDKKYSKGIDYYFSYFDQDNTNKILGEIAPSYFHSPEAPYRIHDLNPNCKIIVTLREPIDRLISYYLHMLRRGDIGKETSFRDVLQQENFLNSSKYYYHLSRWISLFGAANVKILYYELLRDKPDKFVKYLCQAVGVKNLAIQPKISREINTAGVPINYDLIRLLYKTTRLLRKRELHGLVNFGKSLGWHNLLFKKNYKFDHIPPEELEYALALISEDIKMLEESLGLDLFVWRESWHRKNLTLS
jgi:hypothetical protein